MGGEQILNFGTVGAGSPRGHYHPHRWKAETERQIERRAIRQYATVFFED
jgi:hypothetical protein